MNTRLTILLAGVLVVLLGGVWYSGNNPAATPTPAAGDRGPTLIEAGASDITEIVVTRGGQEVAVHRADGDNWTYSTAGGAAQPADAQRIRSLTTRLAGMTAQSTITEQPDAAALQEYGLETPEARAVIKASSMGEKTLVIGDTNALRTGKYVRLGDSGPVYLAEAFLLDDLLSLTAQLPVAPTPTATAAPTATPEATATP